MQQMSSNMKNIGSNIIKHFTNIYRFTNFQVIWISVPWDIKQNNYSAQKFDFLTPIDDKQEFLKWWHLCRANLKSLLASYFVQNMNWFWDILQKY